MLMSQANCHCIEFKGEAELTAMSKCGAQVASIISSFNGLGINMFGLASSDATAAIAFAYRHEQADDTGHARKVQYLWIQEAVRDKTCRSRGWIQQRILQICSPKNPYCRSDGPTCVGVGNELRPRDEDQSRNWTIWMRCSNIRMFAKNQTMVHKIRLHVLTHTLTLMSLTCMINDWCDKGSYGWEHILRSAFHLHTLNTTGTGTPQKS